MKIGLMGLGQMGKPIAVNLLKGGDEVTVVARTDRTFDELRRHGARCSTVSTDLSDVDVLFLCLPSGKVVQETLVGAAGLLERLKRGHATVVDLSTVSHGETITIVEAARAAGIDFVDAPISGMEARAVDGALTIMCGGERPVFDRIKPLLERIGNKILFMGPVGSGQLAKLVNQLLFDINAAALAEILPMAAKMGLDPEQVGEVVNSGTGRSYASEFFVPRILRGHFGDGYPMGHAYKDLISGADIGARLCIPMPVLAAATATYQTALLRGHGHLDKGAMVKVYEEILDAPFRAGIASHRSPHTQETKHE
jgi:3-hydroxyisobutyrate dehydrogenase-like beta-hydroxyacid dehydrogenase